MAKRYQQEIEEILKQVNEQTPDTKSPSAPGEGKRTHSSGGRRRNRTPFTSAISPGRLLMGGIALLVIALLLGSTIPGLKAPMVWGGVALLILAYFLFFTQTRQPSQERRWRGRSLEDEPSSSQGGLLDRVRSWLRKR